MEFLAPHFAPVRFGVSMTAFLYFFTTLRLDFDEVAQRFREEPLGDSPGRLFSLFDEDQDGSLSATEVAHAAKVPAAFVLCVVMFVELAFMVLGFVLFVARARKHLRRMVVLHEQQPFPLPRSNTRTGETDTGLVEFLHEEFSRRDEESSGGRRESLVSLTPGTASAASCATPAFRTPPTSPSGGFGDAAEGFVQPVPMRRQSNSADSVSELVKLTAGAKGKGKGEGAGAGARGSWRAKEFRELVGCFDAWDFDVFRLPEKTTQPLLFAGFVALDGLSHVVSVDKRRLVNFLSDVENAYNDVPYHNSLHGAFVGKMVYSYCVEAGLGRRLPGNMQFALVLAGLVHDVAHPGVNASYLMKVKDEKMDFAFKYNDQSPLEHMHLAVTFALLRRPGNNFADEGDLQAMRPALIRTVLGTDMAKHAESLTRLDALLDNLRHSDDSPGLPWHWPLKPPSHLPPDRRKSWTHKLQTQFVMELFLHAADISAPTLPYQQFRRWNRLVNEEFHMQGRMERAQTGVLISPPAGFDEAADDEAKRGFTSFFLSNLVKPLFSKISELTRIQDDLCVASGVDLSQQLRHIEDNIVRWKKESKVSS